MSEGNGHVDFASRVKRLLDLTPESAEAEAESEKIASQLMAALDDGGRAAGEILIASLAEHGYQVVRVPIHKNFWRIELPPPRVLEIWFNPEDDPYLAAMSYRIGKPKGTPVQIRAAQRQKAFYKLYEQLIPIGESEIAKLSPGDRLILVIGEFEADVNNGGFGQYFENKGMERARETLGYLADIGAKRTADWLSSALEAPDDSDTLERLDSQFLKKPQDLASMVMRYLSKQQ